MKKNNKKRVAVYAFAAILTSVLATNVHTIKEAKTIKTDNGLAIVDVEEMMQTEEFKESLNKSLEESFGPNYQEVIEKNSQSVEKAKAIDGMFMKARSGETIYPDYYGGMYIDNNEDLVVQIVEDKIPEENSVGYSNYLEMLNNSKIEYVKNTYNELKSVNEAIIEYFTNNSNEMITSNYIDVVNNVVIVKLSDSNLSNKVEFERNVVSSELIKFEEGDANVTTATYNAGYGMSNGAGWNCTIGYRAKIGNVNGFITAGHCTMGKGYSFYTYGDEVVEYSFEDDVDAAFVKTSHTITNNLQKTLYPAVSLSTSDITGFFVAGQMVGKVGGITGVQSGKITVPNWAGMVQDRAENPTKTAYLTNQVATNVKNAEGDSGGPVFLLDSANATLVGITSSMDYKNPYSAKFTRANNIKKKFGLTRY